MRLFSTAVMIMAMIAMAYLVVRESGYLGDLISAPIFSFGVLIGVITSIGIVCVLKFQGYL